MERISDHITYQEAIKSQTGVRLGIVNQPSEVELANMIHVGKTIFDPVREFVGGALFVSSFFRCEALNSAIGGSSTSQHRSGEAVDVDAQVYGGKTNKEIFDFIRLNLEFDQLIWEFGTEEEPDWVHVSKQRLGQNRGEILVAYKRNGWTKYKPWNG